MTRYYVVQTELFKTARSACRAAFATYYDRSFEVWETLPGHRLDERNRDKFPDFLSWLMASAEHVATYRQRGNTLTFDFSFKSRGMRGSYYG